MSDSELTLAEQLQRATARVKVIVDLQNQIAESVRQIQDVLLFDGHPEMVRLDDELDNLYPGAHGDR